MEATGISVNLLDRQRPALLGKLKEMVETGELSNSEFTQSEYESSVPPKRWHGGEPIRRSDSAPVEVAFFSTSKQTPSPIVESGFPDWVRQPEWQNAAGDIDLHLAASAGHVRMVEMLLANGADVSEVDANGWTALRCALKNGHHAVLRALLHHCSSSELLEAKMGSVGDTVLQAAAQVGDLDAIVIFLNAGADPNSSNRFHQTALHSAAWRRDIIVSRHLLNAGADMEVEDFWGSTPFELSIQSPINPADKAGLVRLFLEFKQQKNEERLPIDLDEAVEFLTMESIYDKESSENVFKAAKEDQSFVDLLPKQLAMNDLAEELWETMYGPC